VVDGLKSRIRTVEGNVADARDENGQLNDALDSADDYINSSAQFAVTDRLADVPVLVIAVRGVDEAVVESTVTLAREAGGSVPGVLWLEPRWAAEGDDLDALAEIVGSPTSADREDLWADAWRGITDELAAESVSERLPVGGQLGSESGATGPGTLADLEAAGFVTLDSLDDDSVVLADLSGSGPRMLVITGARAQEEIAPIVPVAVEASVGAGLVTVVADVHVVASDAPARGATLVETLDETLRDAIVMVDNADLEMGRVAAVLALDDGQVGLVYGFGDGADAVLPAWTPL
jgi:hypothetical protein